MVTRNLVLTGFMGVGKTSVGRLLSERMNMLFVDTDAWIEERHGRSVAQIFAQHGESAFRELEHQVCVEISKREGCVISTGGAMLLSRENRELFRNDSVFCLQAPWEVIEKRLGGDTRRPLLKNARELWIERRPLYARIGHQVDSGSGDGEQVADRIRRLYELDGVFRNRVHMQRGAFKRLPEFLDWLGVDPHRVAVISNTEIAKHYADKLPKTYELILIPEGEQSKTLETVRMLYEELLARDFTRRDTIVALGGGVVGDITGFVAATYWRGMNLVQVPTTLLAMVDSSLGGKTGVDLPQGKNLVGAFKPATGILVDPDFLSTLPEREIRCGLAEVVKHAVIADRELFEILEQGNWDWGLVIKRAAQVKLKIVEEDPDEMSTRAKLNLGHTFGHAIELLSNFEIPHGEAVSMGMIMAAHYALEHGLCEPAFVLRLEALLKKLGLPTELPLLLNERVGVSGVLEAMRHDKKRVNGRLKLVLPYGLEDVRVQDAY